MLKNTFGLALEYEEQLMARLFDASVISHLVGLRKPDEEIYRLACREIGLPPEIMRGIAVVSRAGGLIGHLLEEQRTHVARRMWALVDRDVPYEDPT